MSGYEKAFLISMAAMGLLAVGLIVAIFVQRSRHNARMAEIRFNNWAEAARLLADAYDFMDECYGGDEAGCWKGAAARQVRMIRRYDHYRATKETGD